MCTKGKILFLRVYQTLRLKKVTEPKPGIFIFDMGQIFARRQREDGQITLILSMLVDTTALLTLPCSSANLSENEKPVKSSTGVSFVGNTDKNSCYRMVSCKYRFDFML